MDSETDSRIVLIIDDDPSTRMMVRECLVPAGFTVIEAGTGPEGIAKCRESRPDIVLLDIIMPDMDGFEVLTKLREIEENLPVLMLTGLDDVSSIQKAYQLRATDFVTKPIPWLLLEHRVNFLLRAREVLQQLEQSTVRMANAQRVAGLGTWDWYPDTSTVILSAEGARIFGLPEQTLKSDLDALLQRVCEEDRGRVVAWLDRMRSGNRSGYIEHRIQLSDVAERIVRQRAQLLTDDAGRPQQVCVVAYDVTEWRNAEEEIRYQNEHDVLTGLDNQMRFRQRVEEAIVRWHATGDRFAVLSVGIDRFKQVNESLGHSTGNRVLSLVAERLQQQVRKSDPVVDETLPQGLARLGGDEFSVLLQPLDHNQSAARVAWRIIDAFGEPFDCCEDELFLSVSAGVAIYPDDGSTAEELMQAAETATHHSKEQGGNTVNFSSPEMNKRSRERLNLETSLRRAVEREEFEVYYQPKLTMKTGRIEGMEALLRWNHPELGLVAPGGFIPLAEETGLIVSIGSWTMEAACTQAEEWRNSGMPVPVSVNFSADQFRRSNPVQNVQRVLQETGLPAELLDIEITESVLMRDHDQVMETLHQLKKLGISLSLDDFGTGYSSFSYLRRFPVDCLKIDRMFIEGIPGDADACAIATAILRMSQSLGLHVVAEGVETEDQMNFLRERDCDSYQGFLFSPPVPAVMATSLLTENSAELVLADP